MPEAADGVGGEEHVAMVASMGFHEGVWTTRICEVSDIPHCLCHSGEYSAIQSLIRFPKELQQVQVLLGKIEHQGPLPRKA